MKGLTKKQEKKFVQIYCGSLILHHALAIESDFTTVENQLSMEDLTVVKANQILKGLPSFGNTDEILNYVRESY